MKKLFFLALPIFLVASSSCSDEAGPKANQTPGAVDWPNFEALSSLFRNNPPSDCFPIPDAELDTNPNLR